MRRNLARITLARPGLLEGLVRAGIGLERLSLLPADSGLRIRLGLLEGARGKPGPGRAWKSREEDGGEPRFSYFSGCLARHLQPSVGSATRLLVRELAGSGLHEPESQACCGMASWSTGNLEEARRLARNNIAAFENRPGPVLTSCASCTAHLARYPALFEDDPVWQGKAEAFSGRVRDFSAFLLEKVGRTVFPAPALRRVFYHEPCHLRFGGADRDAPRDILRQVADIALVEPDVHHCCGQGGLFHLGYPELSERIFARADDAARAAEPDAVVTGCSGCLLQWQAGMATRPGSVPVLHLAVFLGRCLEAATPNTG